MVALFQWQVVSSIVALWASLRIALCSEIDPVIKRLAAIEQNNELFYIANNNIQWSKTAVEGNGIRLTGKTDASTRQLFRVMNVNLTDHTAIFYFHAADSCLREYLCIKSLDSVESEYSVNFSQDLCVFEVNETLVHTEGRVNIFDSKGRSASKINDGQNYVRFSKGASRIHHNTDDWNITVVDTAPVTTCSPTFVPTFEPTTQPSQMPSNTVC